jgi:hypothetical protein
MFGLFGNKPTAAIVIHNKDGDHIQTIRHNLSRNAIEEFMRYLPERGLTTLGHRYWKVPMGDGHWVTLTGPDGSKVKVFAGSSITYVTE